MKALSIRQPWAWAVVNGYKPVENRTTDFVGRWRGPLLIHAGKQAEERESWYAVRALLAESGEDPETLPELAAMPVGGIVGRAELIDVVTFHPSPWFSGPVGLVLAHAKPEKLKLCRGQLGLFEVDERWLGLSPPPADPAQGRLL
jgi:hypothetical protein